LSGVSKPQRITNEIAIVNAQVNEMQLVREKVYNMEQAHLTAKAK